MNFNIAVIPGDGIGPEVVDESIKVLSKIGEKYNHNDPPPRLGGADEGEGGG